MKKLGIFLLLLILVSGLILYKINSPQVVNLTKPLSGSSPTPTLDPTIESLSIESMKKRTYSGSDLVIEETLSSGSNYQQYIASYLSDGLKIYGLLTVPNGEKPPGGWPIIIFNHGYIPPTQYKTTERYAAYVDGFARSGYVVFKSDYRGHSSSEGKPEGAYYSPAYATDVLNALSAVKKKSDINPNKIGMWGHSMGGNITLRDMVVSKDIKAGVIWGGVVGSYDDLINNWQKRVTYQPSAQELALRNRGRQFLLAHYGQPSENSFFWKAIDPTYHLDQISAPIQLHAGSADEEVPPLFSEHLKAGLEKKGKYVELFTYPSADHNISQSFDLAMERSIAFFDKYLK